jgi:hypothetical protein
LGFLDDRLFESLGQAGREFFQVLQALLSSSNTSSTFTA